MFQKRRLAQESLGYNLQDKIFCELFPEIETEINNKLRSNNENEANSAATNNIQIANSNLNQQINNRGFSFLGNFFFIVGIIAFALVVKYVFNTMN